LKRSQIENTKIIVAVSGGPDSLTLLSILASLNVELNLSLHVAHLDHSLRESSKEDALFVERIAGEFGLQSSIERINVWAYAKENSLSIEHAGRQLRYDFLSRVATTLGTDTIALGHTADDQAETVLLHLVRGSGIHGLQAMSPVSRLDTVAGDTYWLVRPLLEISKEETEKYCSDHQLSPRHDESNLLPTYRRNYIRMEIIPRLRQLNPQITGALTRLALTAKQEVDYIESIIEAAVPSILWECTNRVVIDKQRFNNQPPVLKGYLLRRAFKKTSGSLSGLEQFHIEKMIKIMTGPQGKGIDLPGGIRFETTSSQAWLTSTPSNFCPIPILDGEFPINVPGTSIIPGLTDNGGSAAWVSIAEFLTPTGPLPPDPQVGYFDLEKLNGDLIVRTRIRGDRFTPFGVSPTERSDSTRITTNVRRGKKLQDFLINAKIPQNWRDRIPLLVSPTGIAWVVGYRIADWARVTAKTTSMLRIQMNLRLDPMGDQEAGFK